MIFQFALQICAQNFEDENGKCVCNIFLSQNGKQCAKNCAEFGETELNGKCVQIIQRKSVTSHTECITLYNQGSIWDGSSGCKCAAGYAGAANSFCTDCRRLGQVVSGTSCAACSGNTVLQNNLCQECSNMVPSADKLSCVTCSSRYGDGSIYQSSGTCVCDTANGFAGATNSVCTDCWRKGQAVSGTSCAACSGTQVLQYGACQECPANFVPSVDKQSCISCSQRYSQGSVYSTINTCLCDSSNGFSGTSNSICSYCWVLGKTISGSSCASCSGTTVLQSGTCQECAINLIPSADKQSCITCVSRFGPGSIYSNFGTCVCDTANGYAGNSNSVCADCLRIGQSNSLCQGVQITCSSNEIWSVQAKACICNAQLGYAGVSGACYCDRQLGFAPSTNGNCENCWSKSQQALPNGCQPCATTEVFSTSSKTCVCDSSLGYTGVSGGCYCNFGIGLTQIIDNNGVKSCGCNQNTGHVLDASSSTLSCKCDSSTGHSGQPGACFCNQQTGNFGYPGNCQCNYNLQFVGSPGSCMNCSALNARASQFNGKDFCQCNNDRGYGSPDANGKCKLCLISNSIIQIDNDGQYQCIACAATEKVVNNVCVCTSQRISRININKN
ncbi:Growth_factor receptor cysteine-rich domain superfamily [Hexamita inflata]|uniref:Growth factor receptor cysteine-rich domain superfamily n=1 Tax=Hexamita inflata TaxID=28002 RepID=A0AA86NUM7_9EUKA|nr:Growth factor receptor cysteine-rich domain superfamily [Hexamita inflata]